MGGLFLICFDSLLLQKIQDHGNDCYGSVGTFVDLVSQTPSMSGMQTVLVTMKCETSKESTNLEQSCLKLLEITKDHLTSHSSELFLVNEMITTPSNQAASEISENLRTKIATLCSDGKLKQDLEEIRTFSWKKFIDAASQEVEGKRWGWWSKKRISWRVKVFRKLSNHRQCNVMIEYGNSGQDELKLDPELETNCKEDSDSDVEFF